MKKFFSLIALALIVLAATQYVPAYLAMLSFNDNARQEIKFAASARRTTEDVRRALVAKADELGIAMDPKDIRITRNNPVFTVDVDYVFPINMQLYHQELRFHFSEQGELWDHDRN